jgi:hypothetical protein
LSTGCLAKLLVVAYTAVTTGSKFMKNSYLHAGYISMIIMILIATSTSKDKAIQEQRDLCYQVIESAKVLNEAYKEAD